MMRQTALEKCLLILFGLSISNMEQIMCSTDQRLESPDVLASRESNIELQSVDNVENPSSMNSFVDATGRIRTPVSFVEPSAISDESFDSTFDEDPYVINDSKSFCGLIEAPDDHRNENHRSSTPNIFEPFAHAPASHFVEETPSPIKQVRPVVLSSFLNKIRNSKDGTDQKLQDKSDIPYIDSMSTSPCSVYYTPTGDNPNTNDSESEHYERIESSSVYLKPNPIFYEIWDDIPAFRKHPFSIFYTRIFGILKSFTKGRLDGINMFARNMGLGTHYAEVHRHYNLDSDYSSVISLETDDDRRDFMIYIKHVFANTPAHLFETLCVEQDMKLTPCDIKNIISMLNVFDGVTSVGSKTLYAIKKRIKKDVRYVSNNSLLGKNIKDLVKAEAKLINANHNGSKCIFKHLVSCGAKSNPKDYAMIQFHNYFATVCRLIRYMNVLYELDEIGKYVKPGHGYSRDLCLNVDTVGREFSFWLRKAPNDVDISIDLSEISIDRIPIHIFMISNATKITVDLKIASRCYPAKNHIICLMKKLGMMKNLKELIVKINNTCPVVLNSPVPILPNLKTLEIVLDGEIKYASEHFIMKWIGGCTDLTTFRLSAVGLTQIPWALRTSLESLPALKTFEVGERVMSEEFIVRPEDLEFLSKLHHLKVAAEKIVLPLGFYDRVSLESYCFTYEEIIDANKERWNVEEDVNTVTPMNSTGSNSTESFCQNSSNSTEPFYQNLPNCIERLCQNLPIGRDNSYVNIADIVVPKFEEDNGPYRYRSCLRLNNFNSQWNRN